jgi:hypothetical protein
VKRACGEWAVTSISERERSDHDVAFERDPTAHEVHPSRPHVPGYTGGPGARAFGRLRTHMSADETQKSARLRTGAILLTAGTMLLILLVVVLAHLPLYMSWRRERVALTALRGVAHVNAYEIGLPAGDWRGLLGDWYLQYYHRVDRLCIADLPGGAVRGRVCEFAHLRELDLTNTPLDDTDLAWLAAMTELTRFSCFDGQVSDGCLSYLANSTRIIELVLCRCGITDARLVQLAASAHLKELGIVSDDITSTGLAQLAGLAGIRRLELSGARIADAGLAHLSSLVQLRLLRLSAPGITDAGLVHLSLLANLEHLEVERGRITDAGLLRLAKLTSLRQPCRAWP